MHLYLIRHAQSANNEIYARTGSSEGRLADPPLTEIGHRQARLLAQFLIATPSDSDQEAPHLIRNFAARHDRRGFALTHLYCSLMIRAIQTAGYVAATTGLPLVGWKEVHERGGLHMINESTGQEVGLPGPDRAYFEREYPHLILPDVLDESGWWNRAPESLDEAIVRAQRFWDVLIARHGDSEDRVAVVSHAGFFQSLVTVLLSAGYGQATPHLGATELGFGMSNTSISRFEIDNELVILRYLNRVDFLPDELVTG